jgi:hypothetical protein
MTTLFTCDDLNAAYTVGKCMIEPNERKKALLHLWFSYAVDVGTDLAGMCGFSALKERCG